MGDNTHMLGKLETRKDLVQVAVESAFSHVASITAIIAGAGREITRELGDWATEVFEMRDAARRAQADRAATEAAQAGAAQRDIDLDLDRQAVAAEHRVYERS
jgi:hypothetical protein